MKPTQSRLTCSTGVVISTLLLCVAACIVSAILLATQLARGAKGNQPVRTAFNGTSANLSSTVIVPTLDSLMPPGQNVLWSASFVSAAKQLSANVVKGQLQAKGTRGVIEKLEAASNPSEVIPTGVSFSFAGIADAGTVNQAEQELNKALPGIGKPFLTPDAHSAFAFAALRVNVPFPQPYLDYAERKPFHEVGKDVPALFFGIPPEDAKSVQELRNQLAILFSEVSKSSPNFLESYGVDIDKGSTDFQTILAYVKPQKTLGQTVEEALKRIESGSSQMMGDSDSLKAPRISFDIEHHFSELEGKKLEMPGGAEMPLSRAMQMIEFRFGSGKTSNKASTPITEPQASHNYAFDRPFLLMVRKRNARNPFLAMWIENAELIQKKP